MKRINKPSIIALSLLLFFASAIGARASHIIVQPSVLCVDGTSSPYNQVQPGDTLFFAGGPRTYLLIRNFTGDLTKPILFMNVNGPVTINTDWHYGIVFRNCKYIRMTGTGDPNFYYGFMITRVQNGAGLSIGELSSYTEIDHVYIDSVSIAGIYAKTDPDCSFTSTRDKFTQYNTIIHDCYIAHTGDEGLYIGSSFYSGKTLTCNGKDTLVYPHLMQGVRIYNNIVRYSGWDGIQVGSASVNCQIFNNLVMFDSQSETNWQMSGILVGGGSQCDVYNNYIYKGKGDGIESLGIGDYRIFNNIIVDAGRSYCPNDPSKMKYGIYVNDNSALPGLAFTIVFNDIINPKSNGIRFSSAVTTNNLIASNAIINPGLGSNAYIVVTSPSANVSVKNNYCAPNTENAGFVDSTFRLAAGSPLINNGYSDGRRVYFDYFYRPRPSGPRFDIGTYEYNPAIPEEQGTRGEGDSAYNPREFGHFTVDPVPFPNPVQKNLTIAFTIDEVSDVELIIYDMRGTGFYHEDQIHQTAGEHFFKVDTEFFPEGVCLFSLRSNGQSYTGKFYKVK
jgi:hypothetical protein